MFNFGNISDYLQNIVFAVRYTILIALLAAFFGFILGTIIALLKASKMKLVRTLANVYTDIMRGTPMLLQLAIVWYLVFGSLPINVPAIVAAVIAFSLNSGAYISEIMRSGIQNVDKGQIEAAKSMGVSDRDIAVDIIIPQAIKKTLPPLINEFAVLIKESSIVYVIGVADIMYHVNRTTANTYQYFEPLIVAGICYYVLVKLVTYFGRYVEVKLSYDKNQ